MIAGISELFSSSIAGAIIGGSITAAATTRAAYKTLAANSGLNRAKFLYDLHRDFFANRTYSEVLDALDEETGHPKIAALLDADDPELIRLLNAFELVAYFEDTGQLVLDDVKALLGYYIGCISKHPRLQGYIKNHSFEYLDKLPAKLREIPHGV